VSKPDAGVRARNGRLRLSYATLVCLIITLTVLGYPLVAVAVTLLNLDSQVLSQPFRAALFVLSLMLLLFGNRVRNFTHVDRLLMFFLAAYFVRLVWDWQVQSIDGAGTAILFFVMVVVFPTLAAVARVHCLDERQLRQMMLVFGLTFLVLVLIARNLGLDYNPWADQGYELDRLMFQALNPITIGRVSGVVVLVSLISLFEIDRRALWRFLAFAGLAIGIFATLLANSRGPIVALLLAIAYVSLSRPRVLIFNIVVGVGYLALDGPQGDLFQNVLSRFTDGLELSDGSSEARLFLMRSGWNSFLEQPIFGAFYIDPKLGVGLYPHNLFIESAMAMGVFGLAIFVALNVRMLGNTLLHERAHFQTVKTLLIYFFISILFSGALWGSAEYFIFLALGFALSRDRRKYRSAKPSRMRATDK
jgi:hypothetical protein